MGFGAASRAVLVTGTPPHNPNQISIIARGGLDVCDGGHSLGVMKKVKGPAQAKLGRGTLQRWDGRGVRAIPVAEQSAPGTRAFSAFPRGVRSRLPRRPLLVVLAWT